MCSINGSSIRKLTCVMSGLGQPATPTGCLRTQYVFLAKHINIVSHLKAWCWSFHFFHGEWKFTSRSDTNDTQYGYFNHVAHICIQMFWMNHQPWPRSWKYFQIPFRFHVGLLPLLSYEWKLGCTPRSWKHFQIPLPIISTVKFFLTN